MSEEGRKSSRQSTGTVPKIKYRNNTSNERERSRSLTNNLTSYWRHPSDPSNLIRNSRRNQRNNYFSMDTTLEEPTLQSIQNGSVNFNQTANGIITPNTSSSTSRRNSSSLKCDNVTKYPDKKQIEDKLHQIREYLKITNSLMTSIKNTDDQTNEQAEKESLEKMINDLKDSEKKLLDILDQMNSDENEEKNNTNNNQLVENGVDNISEHSASPFRRNERDVNLINPSQEIDVLKDQQMALLRLQQKAENKLRDARHVHAKMTSSQYGNDINDISNRKDNKFYTEHDFDSAIKELEDRTKRLRSPQVSNQNVQENIMAKVESLHNQIITMHNANDERENLIEALDNRDTELRLQHAELQNKLQELQNKKSQVDQLVSQLQGFGDEEEEDVGGQVRKIVTMKDQLQKLKDMLELVKTTENMMQNTNPSAEAQALAYDICTSAENYLEKDIQKPKLQSQVQNETNVLRNDNYNSSLIHDNQPKEVNKRSTEQGCRGVKPRITSFSEKLSLQAELEAKKKELEEIMGKHKASSSNLNHDVGIDVKSEFSCTSNAINEAWVPLIPPQSHHADSDRFSSDDCQEDINDYSEMHDNHNILNLPTSNYSHMKNKKFSSVPSDDYIQASEYERSHGMSRTPERNIRSNSVATSGYVREHPRSNTEQETKTQVQKQLQLIKSVCDSMLEQQAAPGQQSNVQQLRNNLTPSPLYSEPRRFTSPNPHSMNALNVINPTTDAPWFPGNNIHGNLTADINNYQNWLATNTIQTQSFMLNTLNQCCQMLWLQQRELISLRNSVTLLQERGDNNPYGGHPDQLAPPLQTSQDQRSSTQYRPPPNQKINHVSAAFSLPNLNQYNPPPSNLDPNYINQNNVQSGRLLDPCLNNVNHLNATQDIEHANNILHGVNSNINHSLPNQMWNGQALNNQVAPGNRANNYWDNFRSYSRQNLLSTKNNEVLQNPGLDRSNTSNERTNPFSLMTFSKSNSEQDSTSTSQENTPQRRGPSFRMGRHENTNTSVIPPPDVLNINHTSKVNGHLDLSSSARQENSEDVNLGLQMLLNINAYNDTCSNHSNISEEHIFKECIPEQSLRRNEWNDDVNEEMPKTKLFDELRENVYKEVASLISANEARPHFLIQLFRDLQMIGSDSLRLKILQSIQMVITHSLMSSQNSNRHSLESQQTSSDHEGTQNPECFSLQSTLWSKPIKNSSGTRTNPVNIEIHNTFKGALPFLNDHEDEVIQSSLLVSLKQILLGSESFKELVKDVVFQKHFSNVLDDVLEQYRGKNISDVKMHLIQTLNDLLCGELSFIQLIQETNPEPCLINCNSDVCEPIKNFSGSVYEPQHSTGPSQVVDNIQNGDLAEADQTRILNNDIEDEEGAVGGILENEGLNTQITCDDMDLTIGACNVEGLDQVPTRLPIKVISRSATPNKDRSNSHADPDSF